MTQKDFEESLNAVLMEELEDTITAAELTTLQKKIVARVALDWDPFEDADPLDVAADSDVPEGEEDSFSYEDSRDFESDDD